MAELMELFGGWTWWIIAAVLLVSELLVMSIFLVWLGLAALTVGIVDLIVGLEWQAEVVLFVILSVVYVFIGRRNMRTRAEDTTDQPHLNQRINAFVGRTVVLHEAIANGEGKVKLDDALWRVSGTDAPAGSSVRITGVSGMMLLSEPA
jgi:membrane protein implicated in regulation of membrane protease activity